MVTEIWRRSISKQNFTRIREGDIWGGLAASAVILPQAMAFGVALFTIGGIDSSQGAVAGLLGTVLLCSISGIFGGTHGLISAPTGPVLVLLGGAMTILLQLGITNDGLLANMAVLISCAGIFQITFGLTGGGKLIKYIPYPVISGFLTGSAILMAISQIEPLSGVGVNGSWKNWHWIPAGTAIFTLITTWLSPRFFHRLPGTITGLLAGTLVFHIATFFSSAELPSQWLIGELPRLDSIRLNTSLKMIENLHWEVIIPTALALAILASLDTLLTAVIADVTTGQRHNANREIIAQGIGQTITGLFGGMSAAGTTGATVIAVKTGGGRWVAIFAAISLLFLMLTIRDIGSILPISVLAGIILATSLDMIDLDIIAWLKHAKTRQDALIAILVTMITVTWNLMIAVGLGIVIAVILFIRSQIRMSVVHRRSNGLQIRSLKSRRNKERKVLEEHGDRIILYELRGSLFFATADSLIEALAPDLKQPNCVILHMRRVRQVDLTAIKYLQQIASRLQQNNGSLIFCDIHKELGVGKRMKKTFKKHSVIDPDLRVLTFNGKDEALEYAENILLEEHDMRPTYFLDSISLFDNELCENLSTREKQHLQAAYGSKLLKAGEKLFSAGEYGNSMYMVISGEIDIRLPTTRSHYKRLANYCPGAFFGELSLLSPGPRIGDAVAIHNSQLLVLTENNLKKLADSHPETAIHLLMTLARGQVEHLRWSSAEIQRLSEW